MYEALLIGWSLGLAAGITPGPLLTLVITTTLQRGVKAGLAVASAPLWSDAPVIAVSLWLVSSLSPMFLGGIGLVGGAFVIFLGFEALWRVRHPVQVEGQDEAKAPRDLLKGALVNLLSPGPWLFWLTVGGPLTVSFWRQSSWRGLGFGAAFYLAIVGSKAVLAVLVARGRQRLDGLGYRVVLIACGLLMIGLGITLGWDGWQALGKGSEMVGDAAR